MRLAGFRVRAFAKINLSLRVLRRHADGYHEVRTVLQSIALHDRVTVCARRGPFGLDCDDPTCPSDQSNLIWEAAERLWAAHGRRGGPHGVQIHLAKRIPIRSGLGGGSSDAAATLRALAAIWGVDAPQVRRVAAALGADVPYFLDGGTVLGLGRGELTYALPDVPARWVALAVPDVGVSTADAYAWWDESLDEAGGRSAAGSRAGSAVPSSWTLPEVGNDLERPVSRRVPAVRRLVRAMHQTGPRYAAMSGSGSAVFGLFETKADAKRAAASLEARVVVTRMVNRVSYQRLAAIVPSRIDFTIALRGYGHS
jgi:4-diphosphocytidyl-2-C-methyl-D-erythritol kinase